MQISNYLQKAPVYMISKQVAVSLKQLTKFELHGGSIRVVYVMNSISLPAYFTVCILLQGKQQ